MIDKTKPIFLNCVYVTHHPASGRFYIGKGTTRRILNQKYLGSGKILHEEILKDLSSPDAVTVDFTFAKHTYKLDWMIECAYLNGWVTDIIETFKDQTDARRLETLLIQESQQNPLCLNLGYNKAKKSKHKES